jgi:nitroimidazol reductase NimA-like FMN-containing flavoprotein (pyridoxamine 5'-phosphate oxidase superfamily)
MTREEREAFLADLHVGVIGIAAPGRGPVVVPIWYSYQPGEEIKLLTNKDSQKTRLLQEAGRFSLCVQNEAPPYQYVSVEGRILSIEEANHYRDLKPIAVRYLGQEGGEKYVQDTINDQELLVKMIPERWSTADYGKE